MTTEAVALTRKDFESGEEPRWCPGCGDYGILAAVQFLLPDLDVTPEQMVFVSGIGCAARFPYYMKTYGVHGIHGRAQLGDVSCLHERAGCHRIVGEDRGRCGIGDER